MALSITTNATLPDAILWSEFHTQLVATGGYEPYVWSIDSDPDGLFSINAGTGALSSIAIAATDIATLSYVGSHTVTVRVTDSHPVSPEFTTKEFTLTVITAPAIFYDIGGGTLVHWADLGDSYLSSFIVGNTDTVNWVAVGGTAPLDWTISSPQPFITIDNGTGVMTVTPDQIGAWNVGVTVTDANTYSAQINPWVSSIAFLGDPNVYAIGGTLGALCSTQADVTIPTKTYAWGGTPPYSYSLAPGSDPLFPGGYISGDLIYITIPGFDTPPDFQSLSLTMRITDSAGPPSTYDYPLDFPYNNTPVLIRDPLTIGAINTPYSHQVETDQTYIFNRTYYVDEVNGIGLLPTGITMDSFGLLSGSTVFSNIFPISVICSTDGTGCYDRWDTTLYITAGITITCDPDPPPVKQINQAYSIQCTATGGDAPYTWLFGINNPVPAGISIDQNTGLITGSIATPGTYPVDVIAQDSLERIGLKTITFIVIDSGATLVDLGSMCAYTKFEYIFTPIFSLGGQPYIYTLIDGQIPPGIVLDPAGSLIGIPSEPGNYSFTLEANPSMGLGATYIFGCNIVIFNSPFIQLPDIGAYPLGYPMEYTFTAVGGNPPLTWVISDLPDGLFFNSITGTLYGTPTRAGTFPLSLTVFDANNCENSLVSFFLQVTSPPIILNPTLKVACQNYEYKDYILVIEGTPPYYWFNISENGLPDGITLDEYTGALSGIPTEYGTFPVTIKVIDSKGLTSEKDFLWVIRKQEECDSSDPGSTFVTKPRLISVESKPTTVNDAFHQLHLFNYLPSVFKEE